MYRQAQDLGQSRKDGTDGSWFARWRDVGSLAHAPRKSKGQVRPEGKAAKSPWVGACRCVRVPSSHFCDYFFDVGWANSGSTILAIYLFIYCCVTRVDAVIQTRRQTQTSPSTLVLCQVASKKIELQLNRAASRKTARNRRGCAKVPPLQIKT